MNKHALRHRIDERIHYFRAIGVRQIDTGDETAGGRSGLLFSVSYTTRKPRGNEVPGESYVFIPRREFEERIAKDEFLEYAEVFGNFYGTHRSVLEQAQGEGKDLILDIDVQGARQLKERIPHAVSVFILAPSRDILEQRLRSRSEDSEEVIQRRLKEAAEEICNYSQYEYHSGESPGGRVGGNAGGDSQSGTGAAHPDGRTDTADTEEL